MEQPQNLSVVVPSTVPVSGSLSMSSAVTELPSMDVSASDVDGSMTITNITNYLNVPEASRSSTPQPNANVKAGAESLAGENETSTLPSDSVSEKVNDVASSSIVTATFGGGSTPK